MMLTPNMILSCFISVEVKMQSNGHGCKRKGGISFFSEIAKARSRVMPRLVGKRGNKVARKGQKIPLVVFFHRNFHTIFL